MSETIVYTHVKVPDCEWCDKAKELLKGRGIVYEEKEVGTDLTPRELYQKIGGYRNFPQIVLNGEHVGDDVLLGDDTGLGKTLQTIIALCYIWDKNPDTKVIVLTNKSAVTQWANEFTKFTRDIKTIVCMGTPPKRRKARGLFETATGPTVLVMGYRSAVGDFSDMQNWKDFIFITDEATAYKNPKTQVHQVCRHLSENASRTWGLTATLIKNNLMEGHGIYSVVVPGLFGSKNAFMMQYCITQMQRIRKPQTDTCYCGLSSESGETV